MTRAKWVLVAIVVILTFCLASWAGSADFGLLSVVVHWLLPWPIFVIGGVLVYRIVRRRGGTSPTWLARVVKWVVAIGVIALVIALVSRALTPEETLAEKAKNAASGAFTGAKDTVSGWFGDSASPDATEISERTAAAMLASAGEDLFGDGEVALDPGEVRELGDVETGVNFGVVGIRDVVGIRVVTDDDPSPKWVVLTPANQGEQKFAKVDGRLQVRCGPTPCLIKITRL